MKKSLIFVLLIALIFGVFTACDGDVFADLIDNDEPAPEVRAITLEIPSNWFYVTFDSSDTSVKTKVVEVPTGCDTWAEFLAEVTNIKVIDSYYPEEYPLMVEDGKVYFCWYYSALDIYQHVYGLQLQGDKGGSDPETITADTNITLGGTYRLTEGSY